MKRNKMNTTELIEYIDFQNEIELDWEEKLSMDYTEGLITLKEAKKEYKRIATIKEFNSFIAIAGIVGIASIITQQLKEATDKMRSE